MGGLSRASLKRLREFADNLDGRGPPAGASGSAAARRRAGARMALKKNCPRDRHRFRLMRDRATGLTRRSRS